MKVDFSIQNQEAEFIGVEEVRSKKLGIRAKNTPYIVSLLTKVYSDKPGSIVREITSNCFDAHVKAGVVGEPVIVRKYIDETGQCFIEFVDNGCGISPVDMDEIYMSLGESDKRESDDFIGAFGLGSKSPLCYTNYFYLITKKDGVEYTYLMNETANGISYDCLVETECDPNKNGTIVRVPIAQTDIRKFEEAIKQQLKYFTDVYVVGFNVPNDYKITSFETFKVREDLFLYDKTKELHVIHGKVTYPIKWDIIEEKPILFNAGLVFENGELDIILNREDLKYTDETIKKLKNKIAEFKKELHSIIFSEKNHTFTNIREYLGRAYTTKGDYIVFNFLNQEISFYKKNLSFIDYDKYLKFKLILNGVELSYPFKTFLHAIRTNSSSILRRRNGSLTKTYAHKFLDDDYSILYLKNNRKICFNDSSSTKLKNSIRAFLNDNNYEAVIHFDVEKAAMLATKTIISKPSFHKKVSINSLQLYSILKQRFYEDILLVNGKFIQDLNIPENYGKEEKVKTVRKSKDSVLVYRLNYNGSSFEREEVFESYIQDKYRNFVYGTNEDKEKLKQVQDYFHLKTSDWMFFYCTKKYFPILEQYPNCHSINDILINKGNSFYKTPEVSSLLSSYFKNTFTAMLEDEIESKFPDVSLINRNTINDVFNKIKQKSISCENHMTDFLETLSKISKEIDKGLQYQYTHVVESRLTYLFGNSYVKKEYNDFKTKNKKYFEMYENFNNFIQYFKLELMLLSEHGSRYNDKYDSLGLISDNIKNYKLQQFNDLKNKI